jgi:hypothetical protein
MMYLQNSIEFYENYPVESRFVIDERQIRTSNYDRPSHCSRVWGTFSSSFTGRTLAALEWGPTLAIA